MLSVLWGCVRRCEECSQGESVSAHPLQQLLEPVEAREFRLKLQARELRADPQMLCALGLCQGVRVGVRVIQGESVSVHLQQQLLEAVEAREFRLKLKARELRADAQMLCALGLC